MKKSILLLLLALPILSDAQKLEIIYDIEKKELKYLNSNGEEVNPIVRKGANITLKIKNYNNYIYNVNIKEEQLKRKISQINGLMDLENPILSSRPILDLTDSDVDGIIDMIDMEVGSPEVQFFEETGGETKAKQLIQQAENSLDKVERISLYLGMEMADIAERVEKFERKKTLRSLAITEVDKIKLNPDLKPDQIKDFATEFLKDALGIEKSSISLKDILDLKKEPLNFREKLTKLDRDQQEFKDELEILSLISVELQSLASGRVITGPTISRINRQRNNSTKVFQQAEQSKTALSNLMEDYKNQDLNQLLSIWYEYEAIRKNDFSTSYHTTGEEDEVIFDVTFTSKLASVNGKLVSPVEVPPIKVQVYGGLKINASVGVNFAQFFERPKSYFVKDSRIVAQDGDAFIPMVTSYMHFYRQSRKSVSIGGSLGFGIPVGGGEGFESSSFFFGPSFFFGHAERFILNTGLMGGKVERLAAGYEQGDNYNGFEDFVPTHSPYQLGYFLGLSFNLVR